MKKHFLLLALATLCSLGVMGETVVAEWKCDGTSTSKMPLNNNSSTIENITLSTNLTGYATLWYDHNQWLQFQPTAPSAVVIGTNNALTQLDLVVDWNGVYDGSADGAAWYDIQFSTESSFNESAIISGTYSLRKNGGKELSLEAPTGAKSAKIVRKGDPNYYYLLLYSVKVTAESAGSQEQQEQPTSTIAEWGYLQSTSSYVNEFPTSSSFSQNEVTVNATYGQILHAGFCAHEIDGLQTNDAAHHFDISVEEGKVISKISTSNSFTNYLQLSFSSETTFDDKKLVGDITTLPGNACWDPQVITETEAPEGAHSARIGVVQGVTLDWNATLYYLKVETQQEEASATAEWGFSKVADFTALPSNTTSTIGVINLTSNIATSSEAWILGKTNYYFYQKVTEQDNHIDITLNYANYIISAIEASVAYRAGGSDVNTITIQFSSESTFDSNNTLGEPIPLTGGTDDQNYTSCTPLVPQNAKSARIHCSYLAWGPMLYHVKVVAEPATPSKPTHTVYFDKGNDAVQGNIPSPIVKQENKTYTLPVPALTYAGHIFAGWIYSVDSQVYPANTQMTMGTDDVTFTAKWDEFVPKAATVEWGHNKNTAFPGAGSSYQEGVTLIGSFAVGSGESAHVSTDTYDFSNSYTGYVDINTNEGLSITGLTESSKVLWGDAAARLQIQFSSNNVFDGTNIVKTVVMPAVLGWGTTESPSTINDIPFGTKSARISTQISDGRPVLMSVVVSVTPETTPRTVHYVAGDGDGTMEDVVVGKGNTFTVAEPVGLSYTGYKFSVWNDGTSDYHPGDEYTMPDNDVTFTAQWEEFIPTFVDATWRYNGDNILPSATASTVNDITLSSSFATNADAYLFGGNPSVYNYEHSDENNAIDITVTEGLVLKNITASINFVEGKGAGNIKLQFSSAKQFDPTQLVGDPVALTGATDQATETPCSMDAPTGALSARIYGPKSWGPFLYSITVSAGPAVEVTHTVSYLAGDGEGTMDDVTMARSKKFNLPQPDGISYAMHNFVGWNDGTTTYPIGAEYTMPDNDVTFTAQWKEFPAIPCVLDINDAALAGTEWSIADGWIKRGDVSPTTGSVTWMVNATKAGEYKVSVNVSCDNTADLLITVYDSEQKSISNLTKASGWQISGVKQLGAVQIPAQGTYTVVATCATAHSHTWFKDLTFEYVKPTPTASFATLMKDLYLEDTYTQTVTTNSTGAVTYSSNNESVATVDPATGEVTAVGQGTATITAAIAATDDLKETSASYTVSVLAAPVAGRKYYIDPGTDCLHDVIENAQENDTVIFRDGTYIEKYSRTFNTTITLMADEGAHPVINTVSYIKPTKGLTIDGIDIYSTHTNYALYLNCSDADDIILKNATISSAGGNNVYVATPINRLIIDNCVLTTSSQYLLHISKAINLISITNSTFMNASHSAIYLQYATAIPIIVDHCTFYNDATSSYYVIHGSNFNSSNMTVSNCVLYNPITGCQKGIAGQSGNNATVTNCMVNNCGKATENTINTNLWTDDPLIYVENGEYYYQGGSPIVNKATDGTNLGDPRWKALQITISEMDEDNTILVANEGKTVDVQLVRTITSGMYNTLALPFAMTADQIANSDFAGSEILRLNDATFDGSTLDINFDIVDNIEAGVPYLITPAQDFTETTIPAVTIAATEGGTETVGDVEFVAILNRYQLTPGDNDYLYLAAGNALKPSKAGDTSKMKGMRAYFHIISQATAVAMRRGVISVGSRHTPTMLIDILDGTATQLPERFCINGQVYIRHNGIIYNMTGARVNKLSK